MDSFKIMDNGIEVRRSNLKNFFESLNPERVYISTTEISPKTTSVTEYENSILIYSIGKEFESFQADGKWTKAELPYVPHPERFILDVNMIVDRTSS